MLLKLAWRNLWRNKRRTLITAASVFFAVLLSIFMVSIQDGMYDKMIDNVVGLQMGYAQVHQKGYWEEQIIDNSMADTPELRKKILADPEVEAVIPRLESFALAAAGEASRGCAVIGVDPEAENELTHLASRLDSGRYFKAGEAGVLIADGLAEKLHLGLGDTLVLIGQGYHAASAAGKYPIVGMLHIGNLDLNSRMVYLPLPAAQEMYAAEGRISSYVLDLKSPQEAIITAQNIEKSLGEEYEAMDWQTMSPEFVQMMEGDKGSNVIVIAILYLIVGFGIFGTVLMMTTERKYEFGVVVAIGMKRLKLGLTVFLETIFVSILGVVAGSVVALPITMYFNANPIRIESLAEAYAQFGLEPVLPTAVNAGIFLDQATTVLVIASIISIYPFLRILRLDPVTSMRK